MSLSWRSLRSLSLKTDRQNTKKLHNRLKTLLKMLAILWNQRIIISRSIFLLKWSILLVKLWDLYLHLVAFKNSDFMKRKIRYISFIASLLWLTQEQLPMIRKDSKYLIFLFTLKGKIPWVLKMQPRFQLWVKKKKNQ